MAQGGMVGERGTLGNQQRNNNSPATGATRRAAPSLQSSGIVRIDFRPVLYICALHAHRARRLRVFLLDRVDNRIHAYSTRSAPLRASAEVLATYTATLHACFHFIPYP